MDSLLLKLAAAEESNLSLFNYVSDLNGEVEKLEQQIDVGRQAPGAGVGFLWYPLLPGLFCDAADKCSYSPVCVLCSWLWPS